MKYAQVIDWGGYPPIYLSSTPPTDCFATHRVQEVVSMFCDSYSGPVALNVIINT